MRAFVNLARSEVRLFFRERQAVFWTFLYPLLMIWLFGVIFGNQKLGGVSYAEMYVPSWIGVNVLTIALYTIGTTLTVYRERGILKRYQATPVRPWAVLGSHVVYGVIVFAISAAVMVVEGRLLFGLSMPKSVAGVVLALALSIFALFPFGLLLASLAKNARAAAALSALVLNIMLLFSGATFPLALFPVFLRHFANWLPLYYVIDLLRAAWNQTGFVAARGDVWALLAIGAISIVLAARAFRWQER